MDDQSPNSSASQSNIDDLVKELSRPQGSPPPPVTSGPASSPSVNPAPRSVPQSAPIPPSSNPLPRPTIPPSAISNPISQPQKPNLVPVAPVSPVTPSVPKEYQSSIRTMSDDLAKLKAGQQPQGVNIPRKIDNTPVPAKPVVPATPAPVPSKPGATASMPLATKSAPLSSVPSQTQKAPISTPIPRPVMPSMPPATPVPATKLDQKNQFYVPPTESKPVGSGSRKFIFVSIAVVVVLLGGLYWYFMIRPDQVAVESPTPTFTPRPTVTPNQDILSTIFTNRGGAIALPLSGDPATAFSGGISTQSNIIPGTLTVIDIVSGASSSAQALTITGLFNRFVASYPAGLSTVLGQNYKFLLYGQKESFDSKGRPVTDIIPGYRLVMINEIASSSVSILQGWESTMSTNLSNIMAITPTKNTGSFVSTSYKGLSVRFKNFPYPDHSIDYALVQYSGKTYLVIAGSREAMFATIDVFSIPGK